MCLCVNVYGKKKPCEAEDRIINSGSAQKTERVIEGECENILRNVCVFFSLGFSPKERDALETVLHRIRI